PAVAAYILGENLRHRGADVLAAVEQRPDCLHDELWYRILGDVATGAGSQQADRELLLRMHRQDQDRQIRLVRTNLAQKIDSRTVRQRNVEQEDIPVLVAHPLQGFLRGSGFAGNHEIRFLREQRLYALAKESVVIGDENPVRRAYHPLEPNLFKHARGARRRGVETPSLTRRPPPGSPGEPIVASMPATVIS